MTFTRRLLLAALGLAASAVPAMAGWNHVANATCNEGPIRRAFKPAADCDPPAPAPRPSVNYETRTYYEPVTVMRAERYTEEVPVQVKSYYWEPVQSYTQRSYYDPCSGECQQVAVPRTSYVRKEECRTETRYLEKVRMVPVQVEREVTETRPVYTYYGPVTRKYGPTTTPAPSEFRNPRVEEHRGGSTYAPIDHDEPAQVGRHFVDAVERLVGRRPEPAHQHPGPAVVELVQVVQAEGDVPQLVGEGAAGVGQDGVRLEQGVAHAHAGHEHLPALAPPQRGTDVQRLPHQPEVAGLTGERPRRVPRDRVPRRPAAAWPAAAHRRRLALRLGGRRFVE